MITILLPSLAGLFTLKSMFFLGDFFFLEKNLLFLLSIFPLVWFLLSSFQFKSSSIFGSKFYSGSFFLVILILFFCFCCSSPLGYLILLESSVIFMVLLVFNLSKDSDKVSSVFFMFLTNVLGSIPFMWFSLVLGGFLLPMATNLGSVGELWSVLSFYLIMVSKIPVYLLHFWLTKAHVSASGAGSMILASLMLKIGTVGLYKFCPIFLVFSGKMLQVIFFSLSVVGSALMSVFMMRFFDVKYVVACSSIVHMSLVTPSCSGGFSGGYISSVLMMAGHGVISCFVFFLVGFLYEMCMNRSSEASKSVESVGSTLALLLFFFFLGNLGFPPLATFVSEFFFVALFYSYSGILIFWFLVSLVLVGKVFILISLNFLFGKFGGKASGELSTFVVCSGIFYSIFFIFMPFFLI